MSVLGGLQAGPSWFISDHLLRMDSGERGTDEIAGRFPTATIGDANEQSKTARPDSFALQRLMVHCDKTTRKYAYTSGIVRSLCHTRSLVTRRSVFPEVQIFLCDLPLPGVSAHQFSICLAGFASLRVPYARRRETNGILTYLSAILLGVTTQTEQNKKASQLDSMCVSMCEEIEATLQCVLASARLHCCCLPWSR